MRQRMRRDDRLRGVLDLCVVVTRRPRQAEARGSVVGRRPWRLAALAEASASPSSLHVVRMRRDDRLRGLKRASSDGLSSWLLKRMRHWMRKDGRLRGVLGLSIIVACRPRRLVALASSSSSRIVWMRRDDRLRGVLGLSVVIARRPWWAEARGVCSICFLKHRGERMDRRRAESPMYGRQRSGRSSSMGLYCLLQLGPAPSSPLPFLMRTCASRPDCFSFAAVLIASTNLHDSFDSGSAPRCRSPDSLLDMYGKCSPALQMLDGLSRKWKNAMRSHGAPCSMAMLIRDSWVTPISCLMQCLLER
ncbi:uncharacterized protein [Elaeis guineensis]|uniref:uncharacterized protein n=1 Tax=Elaeis guineensis var. tenera TaxID=51953 RepID=UPI003C6D9FF3